MVTKKETAKPKAKKASTIESKSIPRKSVRRKPVHTEPVIVSPQPQVYVPAIDEKSLRTLKQLTGFLNVGVVFTAFSLVVQIWTTAKAKISFTAGIFLYIVIALVLIAALIWCARLLNQKRVLSIWVFVGFMVTFILYTLVFRWFGEKALFMPTDIVAWIVLVAILFELNRLQRKNFS